jgi:hypothetical protein
LGRQRLRCGRHGLWRVDFGTGGELLSGDSINGMRRINSRQDNDTQALDSLAK